MKSSIFICLLATLGLFLTGCVTQPPTTIATDTPATASNASQDATTDTDDSAELAYELAHKQWCTNDDMCSLIIYLIGGQVRNETFEQKMELLQSKALVPSHCILTPDEPATKGTFAYMLCRATNTKGGLFMHLVGGRRYAYREAVFQNFMMAGSEYELLTGPEAVGIIGRVSRRME